MLQRGVNFLSNPSIAWYTYGDFWMPTKSKVIYLDESNPIVQVVLPLKKDAAAQAEQYAKDAIAALRKELEENGWDERIVAPYNSHSRMAIQKYYFLHSVCEWDYKKQPGSRGMNGPCLVKMDSNRSQKYIAKAIADAERDYDLFVLKLTLKIGAVTAAKLEGNHVWGDSLLTVSIPDGSEQVWRTHQIVNTSKLGLLFLQWPTRKLKTKSVNQK